MSLRGDLIVLQGRAARRQVGLRDGETLVVGRGEEADLRIDEPVISRRHFKLAIGPAGCTLEDLDSYNGTYLNGQRVGGTAELADRDLIQVATIALRIRLLEGDTRRLTPLQISQTLESATEVSELATGGPTCCTSCRSRIVRPPADPVPPGGPLCPVCAFLEHADSVADFDGLLARHGADSTVELPPETTGAPVEPRGPGPLGPYALHGPLGKGGTGVVYQASDTRTGEHVALKLLGPRQSNPRLLRRFLQEARLLASLDHPGIVRCLDLGRAGATLYMALELIAGLSLEDHLQQAGPLERAALLELGRQLCAAVHHAHQRGVVHRDLSLRNLMQEPDGRLKIIDFGLSRALRKVGREITRTGQLIGTPHYMAPEQIEDPRLADQRSDIYAIGVILFRLASGEYPYAAGGLGRLLRDKQHHAPRPLRAVRPDAPEGLEAVVARALRHGMCERQSTAAVLAGELERALR